MKILFFRSKRKIKTFICEQKLEESVVNRPALKEMIKEVFQVEGKDIRRKVGSSELQEKQQI